MTNIIQKIQNNCLIQLYLRIACVFTSYLFPLLVLFMRIWMARIFWYSGLVKINNWQSTLYLFEYEYAVPILPIELAASLATLAELTCPILLVTGFMTRLSAIPLLFMVAVIQFTYLDLIDHTYWAILLGTIILYGPGRYSLDYVITKNKG